MIQESYRNGIASLYLIPTPIGNLDDMTPRGIKILQEVKCVFCEDTRETSLLFTHLNISGKKLIPCHKFNESKVSNELINELKKGTDIALVTDRGTPLISDPGEVVVKKVIEAGFNVITLPGANAILPALGSSGITSEHFLFYGFLSNKEIEAGKQLKMLNSEKYTIILYESPKRLNKTLQNILKNMGNRNISISREITKMYETVFRGNVEEAIETFNNVKGEIVIVIESLDIEVDSSSSLDDVKELISLGLSSKDSITYIAKKYNISKNTLYNEYERSKK